MRKAVIVLIGMMLAGCSGNKTDEHIRYVRSVQGSSYAEDNTEVSGESDSISISGMPDNCQNIPKYTITITATEEPVKVIETVVTNEPENTVTPEPMVTQAKEPVVVSSQVTATAVPTLTPTAIPTVTSVAVSTEIPVATVSPKYKEEQEVPDKVSPVPTVTVKPELTEVPVNDYSPERVVAIASDKCISGGMERSTDNLNRLLADGYISREEYDLYYPYDGMGYYSVFVEKDLAKATTFSGFPLKSEDEIAGYIADMLLLEEEKYFYIEYAGEYRESGIVFYEFRCYR